MRRILAATTIALVPLGLAASATAGETRASRADRIDDYLASTGSPLSGLGSQFVAAGARWHVRPELIVAIAGVESSLGRNACGRNAWGIASCRRDYRSWTEGIWRVTRWIRLGYLDAGLDSIERIGRVWCPPCGSAWPRDVAWFMRRLGAPATPSP